MFAGGPARCGVKVGPVSGGCVVRADWIVVIPEGAAQDLPHLLGGAAAVASGATVELPVDVVLEVANQELGHGRA